MYCHHVLNMRKALFWPFLVIFRHFQEQLSHKNVQLPHFKVVEKSSLMKKNILQLMHRTFFGPFLRYRFRFELPLGPAHSSCIFVRFGGYHVLARLVFEDIIGVIAGGVFLGRMKNIVRLQSNITPESLSKLHGNQCIGFWKLRVIFLKRFL